MGARGRLAATCLAAYGASPGANIKLPRLTAGRLPAANRGRGACHPSMPRRQPQVLQQLPNMNPLKIELLAAWVLASRDQDADQRRPAGSRELAVGCANLMCRRFFSDIRFIE